MIIWAALSLNSIDTMKLDAIIQRLEGHSENVKGDGVQPWTKNVAEKVSVSVDVKLITLVTVTVAVDSPKILFKKLLSWLKKILGEMLRPFEASSDSKDDWMKSASASFVEPQYDNDGATVFSNSRIAVGKK